MSINLAAKHSQLCWLFCVLLLKPEKKKKNEKPTGQIIFQANLPSLACMCSN